MPIDFGREICGELALAQTREWLVTNGIGGYASGTVAGMLTRSYHGLLIAALQPPLQRTLLVTKLDETVTYYGQTYPLFSNRWRANSIAPAGYENLESFHLEGTIPVWRFTLDDALIEKRIWMQPQANTTYIYYTVLRASGAVNFSLTSLVNYRSYHGGSLPGLNSQNLVSRGMRLVMGSPDGEPFYLLADQGTFSLANEIYRDFQLPIENYRGLNDLDNHLYAGSLAVSLNPGASLTVVATTEHPQPQLPGVVFNPNDSAALTNLLDGARALSHRRNYENNLKQVWQATAPTVNQNAPDWIEQLVLAADQFIVTRPLRNGQLGKSVIAGYHWFEDWGRDTMISLPGLTLVTGHPESAKQIIETFAESISRGMLPNRFPDNNNLSDGDYNTVDATLWYFEAIRHYYAQTGDNALLGSIFPRLVEIINEHRQGTRFNIRLDPQDGLISAGATGVQLTWMDALVNGQVITPRRGKPVEINALWYNALLTMANFARIVGQDGAEYENLAATTQAGFQRFWNASQGYCYDVIDVFATPGLLDGSNDDSLRPNQIFAVSLPVSPLNLSQQQQIVSACERFLLTSNGLRSLSQNNGQYRGVYGGNQFSRDSAYHQGTVWGWLLGPFVLAHLRAYNDPQKALELLNPIAYHLNSTGLGTINEIFDGNTPYRPRGCIAQAWSVAEVLRAWTEIATRLT